MKTKTIYTYMLAGFLMLLVGTSTLAQAPASTSYQAVVRDNLGNPIASSAISVRFSIRSSSSGGTIVYRETQNPSTDQFGLFSANVGEGTASIGDYNTVSWESDDHFLQVEVDAGGGFDDLGIVELTSVPYSFYARAAEKALDMALGELNNVGNAAPSNGQVLKWNGSEWAPATDNSGGGGNWSANGSNVYYNGGFVGIGTDDPISNLHVHDPGPNTYMQISNDITGTTDSDGMEIFMGTSTARIWNNENGFFDIGTNSSTKMSISPDGNVGINNFLPSAGLHLGDNKELKIDLETTDPAPNSYYGNSGPIGYGQMGGGAGGTTIYNDYGITSCVYIAQGHYTVTLDNSWASEATAIVTPYQAGTPKWATASPSLNGNTVTVRLFDSDANPINGDFNIVVFGTPQ